MHGDSLTEEYNGPLLKGELGEIKSFTLHYDFVNPDCITDPKLVEEIERCMIEEDEAARNGSLVHTPLPIKVTHVRFGNRPIETVREAMARWQNSVRKK